MDVTVIAESTPGPIAINCATFTGYKVGGFLGSLISTVGIALPSFTIIYIISLFFEDILSYRIVTNVFKGIQVAVSILIVQAAWKMINKSMKKMKRKGTAIGIIVTFFTIVLVTNMMGVYFSSIWLILVSGIIGYFLYYKHSPKQDGNKHMTALGIMVITIAIVLLYKRVLRKDISPIAMIICCAVLGGVMY